MDTFWRFLVSGIYGPDKGVQKRAAMGLCDHRHGKRADGGLIHQVPGKQKKPGKPDIMGFPGIDTKTALRFGRLFLY